MFNEEFEREMYRRVNPNATEQQLHDHVQRLRQLDATKDILADPGYSLRCSVLDMMKPLLSLADDDSNSQLRPAQVHLPFWAEVLLRGHTQASGFPDFGCHQKPLRPATMLGLTVVYDALELKVTDFKGKTADYYIGHSDGKRANAGS